MLLLAIVKEPDLVVQRRQRMMQQPPVPVLRGAHSAPARRIQAFLVSGLERTGPGNQGGVTVTYTDTPGHNAGL